MFPVSLQMSFGLCQDPTQDPTGHIVVVSPWSPLIYDRCLVSVLHNGDTLEKYRPMVTYLVEWPSVWACLMFPHGTVETVADFIFLGSKITADGDCSHKIKRLTPWKESYDQPRQHIKKERHHFVNKGPPSQGNGFVVMYGCELDYKES